MKRKFLLIILTLLITVFAISFSMAVVQRDLRVTEDKVVSGYDCDLYIVSYKIKNFDKVTVNDVVVTCQIVDGYGEELYTQKRFVGSLAPGQENAGEFSYYRPDKSFQVFHKLSLEYK